MAEPRLARHARIYNLFPLLVGDVASWTRHLPRIAAMNFDWVFLNPIHYPGFSGSLYAIKDHYRLNPLFRGPAEEGRTDDEVISDFVAEADRHGLAVMFDLVINHTSKDALIASEHPEWFVRDDKGELVSPFAVDPVDHQVTTWGDLAMIDYSARPDRSGMVDYWTRLVLHYVRLGIRGFRCDAAYKVPAEVWVEIIRAAREVSGNLWFFAENVGSFFEQVEALQPAGFDFLFNSAKWWDFRSPWLLEQYETFRHIAPSVAFPESHDTPRLASECGAPDTGGLQRELRRRYLFSAAFSSGVMIPIGYEFGFTKALNVVNTRPEDWEAPRFDLSPDIAAINAIKAGCPTLCQEGPQRLVSSPTGVLALVRESLDGANWTLTVINPPGNGNWTLDTGGSDPIGTLAASGKEIGPGRDSPGASIANGLTLDDGAIRLFTGSRGAG